MHLYNCSVFRLITQKDFDIYSKTLKTVFLINNILVVNQRYFV